MQTQHESTQCRPAPWLAYMLCACLLILAPTLSATPAEPTALHLAQAELSLDQAVAQVQTQVEGRVLSAQTLSGPHGPEHHIRILTADQRVRNLVVDARTGQWR